MNIADAVKAQDVQNDPLYRAACTVNCSDLPQDTKDALVKHISDARAKHPVQKDPDGDSYSLPDTRPGPMRAAAGVIAKGMSKGKK